MESIRISENTLKAEVVSFFFPLTNPNANASRPLGKTAEGQATHPVGAQVPGPSGRNLQLLLAEKRQGREAISQQGPQPPALTVQLATKELKAEGTAPVADDRHQPHVLYLQREVKQVDLQATVVHVTHKHLEGKESGGMGSVCGQPTFLGGRRRGLAEPTGG